MEITREFQQGGSKVVVTAKVWEKYGKKNVYFSRNGKPICHYSITEGRWIKSVNSSFFQAHVEETFGDLMGLVSKDAEWLDFMTWID